MATIDLFDLTAEEYQIYVEEWDKWITMGGNMDNWWEAFDNDLFNDDLGDL